MPSVRGQTKNLVVRFIGDTDDLHRSLARLSAVASRTSTTMSGFMKGASSTFGEASNSMNAAVRTSIATVGRLSAAFAIMAGAAVVGGAAAGLALAALPLGFLALGTVAALTNEKIRSEFKTTWESIKSSAQAASQPMVQPLLNAMAIVRNRTRELVPAFREAFAAAAPHLAVLTNAIFNFVQNALPGMTSAIRNAMPVTQALGNTLAVLGTRLGEFFQILGQHANAAATVMEGFLNFVWGLLPVIAQLFSAFAVAAQPIATILLPALGNLISTLGIVISQVFIGLKPAFEAVSKALVPVMSAIGNLAHVAGPVLVHIFNMLAQVLVAVAPIFTNILNAVMPLVNMFHLLLQPIMMLFPVIMKVVGILVQALVPVLMAIIPVVAQVAAMFFQLAGQVLMQLAMAIVPLLPLLGQVVVALGQALMTALRALQPIFPIIIQAFQLILQAVLPLLPPILGIASAMMNALAPILPIIANLFLRVVQALMPLLPPLLTIVQALLPAFMAIMTALMPIITLLANVLTGVLGFAIQFVILPILNVLAFLLKNVIAPAFTFLGMIIGGVVSFIQLVWNALGIAFRFVWENVIRPVWNALGVAFNFLWQTVIRPIIGFFQMAWDALGRAIGWVYHNLILPVWLALQIAFQFMYHNVIAPICNLFRMAWNALAVAIQWIWNNIIKPAWDALIGLFRFLYNAVIAPICNLFRMAWNALAVAIQWIWNNIIKPAWDALIALFRFLYYFCILPLCNFIRAAWDAVGNTVRWVWNNVIRPAWDALIAAFRFLWNNVFRPICDFIRAAWDGVGNAIRWVWRNTIKPAWDALVGAINWVRDSFRRAVDAIQNTWDRIRGAAAKPVNFVIREIWNNGLRKMINWIGDKIGLNWNLPEVKEVRWASGGYVSGPGGPKADKIPARLSDGEYVVNAAATKKNRGLLEAINSGDTIGHTRPTYSMGLASGGPVSWQQMYAVIKSKFPAARMTSGFRPGDRGYHGRGMAVDLAGPRSMDMPFMLAMNKWIAGTYPGSLELIHTPGINLKNGRPHTYNGATRAQHFNHVHWANGGAPAGSGGGLLGFLLGNIGAGMNAVMPDWAIDPFGKLMNFVKGPFDEFAKLFKGNEFANFAKVPIEMIKKAIDWIVNKIMEAVMGLFGGGAPGSGPVRDQVNAVASKYGWHVGPEWAALDRLIQKESSWNPNAQNPRSTAYGLFQFLNSTWRSVGAARTPNPGLQAEAGLRYIKQRYGSPTRALAFHLRNNWYDEGGIWEPGSFGVNMSGKHEAVLSPEQTRAFMDRTEAGIGTTVNVENVNIYTQKLDKEELLRVLTELETLGIV